MADTTAAPATAPAPTTAPAAPATQGATVTPLKPHHSTTQPREVGKFAGPPQPGEATTPAPPPAAAQRKAWKVGDYETSDPDELAAIAAERVVDHSEYQRLRAEYQRLAAEAERWKEPARALSAEQRAAIARQELEEFLQREQEAKLPPDQRRMLEERRALAAENRRLKEEFEKQQRAKAAESEQKERAETVATVRAVLGILGEEERRSIAMSEVLAEMRANLLQGKQYPPEVIARRVRMRLEAESLKHTARVAKSNPAALLSNPEIVAALNSIQDPALLQSLAPLIDLGRRANLERLGAAPAPGTAAPPAASAPAAEVPQGREPRTDQEWRTWFASGNKPSAPAHYQAQQRLRAKGWL